MASVGAYTLEAPLGAGGMGAVWAAVHRESGRRVALKRLHKAEPALLSAFSAEVRAVAALDHPNIVRVLDHGAVGGAPFMVMPLADGTLGSHTPRSWAACGPLLVATLRALAHAHARGVVHCDIKPSNLLCVREPDGRLRPQLADFGIAQLRGASAEPGRWGTPAYMAPEQFAGSSAPIGPWTDLYAVGCMAIALLAGPAAIRQPPSVLSAARQVGAPPGLTAAQQAGPPGLAAWLSTMLAPHPAQRFPSAAAALSALVPLLDHAAEDAILLQGLDGEESVTVTVTVTITGSSPPARPRAPLPVATVSGLSLDDRERSPSLRVLRPTDTAPALFGLRTPPLVGREADQERLWDVLRAAHREQAPQTIAITGPVGVGCSRLARWLAEEAEERGAAVSLRLRPEDDGLGPMLGRPLQCLTAPRDQIPARLAHILPGLPAVDAENIAALLHGAPFERPQARYELVARILDRLAGPRVAVVWIDDAHLIEDAWPLAAWLARRRRPLVVVLTVPEPLPAPLPEGTPRLRLGPLPRPQEQQLLQQLLPMSPALAAEVAEVAAGNPLLAIQLVGEGLSRGAFVSGPEGWRRRPGASLVADLAAVWDGLLPEAEDDRSLEQAAILGFAPAETAAVSVLAERGLMRRGRDGRWRFVHRLLQARLQARASAADHRAAAGWLAAHDGDPAALGRQHLAGGEPARALGPLRAGIDRAIREGAYERVTLLLRDYERALAALGRPPSAPEWGWAALQECRAGLVRGERAARTARLEALLEAAERHGWDEIAAEVCATLSRPFYRRGDGEGALALLARAPLARLPAQSPGRCFCAESRGWALMRLGREDEAEQAFRDALAAAPEADARLGVRQSLLALRNRQGRLDDARALAARCIEDARQLRRPMAEAFCQNSLGEVARERGEWDEASVRYRAALAAYVAGGVPDAAIPLANLGIVELHRGDLDAARVALVDAIETFERIGRTVLAHACRAYLLQCAARQGRRDACAGLLDTLEAFLAASPLRDGELSAALGDAASHAPWPPIAARAQALAAQVRPR